MQDQVVRWANSAVGRGTYYEVLFGDLVESVRLAPLWLTLGWHDIKQRYRRSMIGPFWITIATLMFVGIMAALYSSLFHQSFMSFLPMAAAGLVTWGLISSCLTEGARVFIDHGAAIRQLPLPLPVHVFRLLWQQFVIMLHNAVVIVLIVVIAREPINFHTILVLPGTALLLINLCWIAMLLGILGARFRDVPIIVNSLVPIIFLATPIFWTPDMLPPSRSWIVELNPIAAMIEVVRAPVLGMAPSAWVWLTCILAAIVGWTMTVALYARCRHRIALWV